MDDISPENLAAFEQGDFEEGAGEHAICVRVNISAGSHSFQVPAIQGSHYMVAIPAKSPAQYQASPRPELIAHNPTMQEFRIAYPADAFNKVMPAAFAPFLWLNEALTLEKANRRDRALDVIFGEVDKLFRKGDFATCNRLLEVLDAEHLSVNLLIAFLTITAPAHEFLPARPRFYSRVEQRLADRPNKDKLLKGLKGSCLNAPRFF